MRYLFLHQNFPGQFRHMVQALAATQRHEVVGVGDARNITPQWSTAPGIRVLGYPDPFEQFDARHPSVRDYEGYVRRGQAVTRLLLGLRDREGFRPDVVVAHPGWGEALFLRDVFPDAVFIAYCEYYFQVAGGDVGIDPEFPRSLDDQLRTRLKNSPQLHALVSCDRGISPTEWQRSRYPAAFQSRIEVVHDGIDTERVRPDPTAWVDIGGRRLRPGDEVVTYVARNLEPYRGFHTFMRSLPALQARRPEARVIIVGGDEVSYGRRLPEGQTYRQRYVEELGRRVDWSRVHFVGRLAYRDYLAVLRVSAAHVYLTYPFVLSWSMLEAMAAGCALVASDTAPVREVIEPGRNGLLVDFFDPERLAETVAEVLAKPEAYSAMRARARETVCACYDLKTVCLPRQLALLENAQR